MDNRCLQGLGALPESIRGCVLTIGNFDGVHLGHQKIIATAGPLADKIDAPVVAVTFEPPPELALRPESSPQRITPAAQKRRLLLEAGCDFIVTLTADRELLAITPADFIEQTVVKRLAPSHIVEGRNFFFGRGRSGNIDTLRDASASGGFETHVVEPVMIGLPMGERRISSSLVRSLILAGRIDQARRCLGRQFALFGAVVPGTGRGKKLLGFPTINLDTGQQVIPADGVYAGRAELADSVYPAAISIGASPTLGGTGRSVEAFLIDAEGDFLGLEAKLNFVELIGEQQKLAGVEALRRQIVKDVTRVREIIG